MAGSTRTHHLKAPARPRTACADAVGLVVLFGALATLGALGCSPSERPASPTCEAEAWAALNHTWCESGHLDRTAFERAVAGLRSDARETAWMRLECVAATSRGEGVGDCVRAALERDRAGSSAGPVAALAFGELAVWTQGAEIITPTYRSAETLLGLQSAWLGPLMPEPTWAAPLECGERRTVAQARALAALRIGTLALTHLKCDDAEAAFSQGLSYLESAGQLPDRHGSRSLAALLLNNWSEKEMHCGGAWEQAVDRRRQAFRWATDVGATDSLGVIGAGLAFLHAEAPGATPADAEVALAALQAVAHLQTRAHQAGPTSHPAMASALAKAHALATLYSADVDGAFAITDLATSLELAAGIAETSEAVYARLTVRYLAARAWASRGDPVATSAQYQAMLEELTLLWSSFSGGQDQRDLFRNIERWLGDALYHAWLHADLELAFSAMERSKDAALLERVRRPTSPGGAPAAPWKIPLPEPVSLTDAQALLAAGEVVVHIDSLGRERGFVALVIHPGGAILRLLGGAESIALAERWREALESGTPSEPTEDDALESAVGDALWTPLIGDLEQLGARHVWLSARGALHGLPWAALPVGGSHRLVDRWALSLAPSVSAVLATRRRSSPPASSGAALLVDVALFDAEREAARMGWPASQPPMIFTSAHELPRPLLVPVVAIKGHGTYDPARPADSAIQLTASTSGDGRLTLAQVSELDIRCAVAVLSSCEAARGDVAPGDQVDSFARAFLAAGAQAVVAPSIPVSTRAADALAEALYVELRAGAPVALALRAAQRALAATPEHEMPSRWAFFTVTGDGTAHLTNAALLGP